MKLLITTQAVDRNDPVLGFFHRWIEEFAKHCEQVTVICLRKGDHSLPSNVEVLSLGKEAGRGRLARAVSFLKLITARRKDYDTVFVHMNQEYILLAGWFWRLFGKRVSLWRNHYSGTFLTNLAALFCTDVFYTSKFSYTAKYPHALQMPVGIDLEVFKPNPNIEPKPNSILFLARMAPSKRPEMLLEALVKLRAERVPFEAAFYGDPAQGGEAYYRGLRRYAEENGIADAVSFHEGVPNGHTPALYAAHEIFVNCSPSGMLDKTIFEAAACGSIPLAASKDWHAMAGPELYFSNSSELASLLRRYGEEGRKAPSLNAIVQAQSLARTAERLYEILSRS